MKIMNELKKRIKLINKIFEQNNYKFITYSELIQRCYYILRYGSYLFLEKKNNKKSNNNSIYYLIRRTPPGSGFFSNFHLTLGHLDYALQNGYKPYIDYENYSNFIYGKKSTKNFRNYWDDYFLQPNTKNLTDIKKNFSYINSQENILSRPNNNIHNTESFEFLNDEILIQKYYNLFTENIYFKENVVKYFETMRSSIFGLKTNVLGASIRGTDYVTKKYPNHYIQPSLEEFIDRIDLLLDKWEVDYIFLSTEDEVYRSDLKKYYGSRIFDMDRQLYDRSSTPMMKGNKNYHSYLLYVCEIFLLSQCDFLVGTPNGGFAAAVIFNGNKYKKKYIFDLGKYN